MTKSKIILSAIGGLVALLVLGAVALPLFVDVDAYKSRLEAAASEAVGMEVRIGGRMGIGLFPGLHVTLADLRIRNRGSDVVSVGKAGIGIDLLPLLHGEVHLGGIDLERPKITIERDRDGRFNFETAGTGGGTAAGEAAPGGTSPAALPEKITVSRASLIYADRRSGNEVAATDCDLDLPRLRLSSQKDPDLLKTLSFKADLACAKIETKIETKKITLSALKASAEGKNGILGLTPVTTRLFGAQGQGQIHADFSGAIPRYDLRFSLPRFRVEELLETLGQKKTVAGAMDFSLNLSTQGKRVDAAKRALTGPVSLRGDNLVLSGVDLDVVFSRFESSQSFSLVDAGAVFLAGPFGLLFSKGADFGSMFVGTGDRSEIRQLVSDWQVERGVARARDVAMATKANRVAITGGLDFVKEQFDDLTVALIDARGCARVQQTIRGAFEKPVVEKLNIVETLAGSALGLLKMGRNLLTGEKCKIFYAGSVASPK